VQSWFLNIMFARFPLLDPDEFLNRWNPLIGRLISKTGAVLWLLVVGFALKIVIDRFPSLAQQSQGILAPSNLFLLYVGLILTKAVHEFGHAFATDGIVCLSARRECSWRFFWRHAQLLSGPRQVLVFCTVWPTT
jgi:putative peptide zinc metalloprotease protein